MKKLILSLCLVSLSAFATLPSGDVRLEFTKSRLLSHFESSPVLSVKVDSKGLAIVEKEGGEPLFLASLTEEEMNSIEEAIHEASVSEFQMDPPPLCEAIPQESVVYSADNGSIVLSTVSRPCGGSGRTLGQGAQRLMETLDKLLKQVPQADIPLSAMN